MVNPYGHCATNLIRQRLKVTVEDVQLTFTILKLFIRIIQSLISSLSRLSVIYMLYRQCSTYIFVNYSVIVVIQSVHNVYMWTQASAQCTNTFPKFIKRNLPSNSINVSNKHITIETCIWNGVLSLFERTLNNSPIHSPEWQMIQGYTLLQMICFCVLLFGFLSELNLTRLLWMRHFCSSLERLFHWLLDLMINDMPSRH